MADLNIKAGEIAARLDSGDFGLIGVSDRAASSVRPVAASFSSSPEFNQSQFAYNQKRGRADMADLPLDLLQMPEDNPMKSMSASHSSSATILAEHESGEFQKVEVAYTGTKSISREWVSAEEMAEVASAESSEVEEI